MVIESARDPLSATARFGEEGLHKLDGAAERQVAAKVYRATPLGRKALAAAKAKVREFIGELMEGQ